MTCTTTIGKHLARPAPAGGASAWKLLRAMFALLVQPHRWGELPDLQSQVEAALAETLKARLLALPELAHLRDHNISVRAVWRGARLDFDVLDAEGRSLLTPGRRSGAISPSERRAIAIQNLRTARKWICYRRHQILVGHLRGLRRNPFRRSRLNEIVREARLIATPSRRAASAALRRFSHSLRIATLAAQVPP